ncbi:MAG: winged helix DNA-binding domain-containing protein [Chloroflexi bacterium]|nr:winged helix DNA-binding domain-containing protein [Chloroflexota bacterium]
MPNVEIAHQRLHNQLINQHTFDKPADVVQWLGAVQAQDYEGAKWAVGQRLNGLSDSAIEQACTEGAILRTHLLRPTWHFVTPVDIRWMLALTAPRVNLLLSHYYRKLGLDDALFAQSNAVLTQALQGGRQLTRAELGTILQQAGIATKDLLRLTHIMIRAELDGVVCSGAKRGKQFTYALLEERAPQAKFLSHEAALAELAKRYFTGHGPATLKDYVWWSGLTVADARAGIEMVQPQLNHAIIAGQTYWFATAPPLATWQMPIAHLLPNYDEYIVGYTDRSAVYDAQPIQNLDTRGNVLFNYIIVIDGKVVGTWKRTFKKEIVIVELTPFAPLSPTEFEAVTAAAQRYGEFLGLTVVLV